MANTFCNHCMTIYPVGSKHECLGSLRRRVARLEEAIKPFLDIEERADYSIGHIKQSDIEKLKALFKNLVHKQ